MSALKLGLTLALLLCLFMTMDYALGLPEATRLDLQQEEVITSTPLSIEDASSDFDIKELIKTKPGSCGVVVNTDTNRVYVANYKSNSLSVYDGSTNNEVASVDVGLVPCGLALNADKNIVYVINEFDNSISVVDGSTNKVVNEIEIPRPYEMVVNPNTNLLYVTSDANDSVFVIDEFTECGKYLQYK